jgi:RNA methyltransferase, TrmH family
MPSLITSPSNPSVKRIRKLRSRKQRESEGVFFVEGIQTVWQAVRNGADIETIVIAPDLLKSDRASRMVATQEEKGTRVLRVGPEAFGSIADRENPSGLGAIVRAVAPTLDRLVSDQGSLFVALDRPQKPGNVGSIIRAVDGAGGSGVIVIGDSTDAYHPTAVKASMGTLFNVPVCSAGAAEEVIAWAAERGLCTITTSAHATTVLWDVAYELPALLLFGSEGSGLESEVLARGDLTVRIPMHGSATSLNLAVSAGILLYEVRRQHGLS